MASTCQKCQSKRTAIFSAKCSDCFSVSMNKSRLEFSGYVPYDMGIGGGDYVELTYCLDCGQIQGKWPLEQTTLDKDQKDL